MILSAPQNRFAKLLQRLVFEPVRRDSWIEEPFNARQISRISLSPEVVDCIVFWTKNPSPHVGAVKGAGGL